MLDLGKVGRALVRAGYPCTTDPKSVWTALFAFAAQRKPDAVLMALGASMAQHAADYGMTSALRLAEFVAQTSHETGGYTRFEENLNYTAQRMAEVWPGRYALDPHAAHKQPNARARHIAAGGPKALGIDTYGLRMGNLDAAHDTDTSPDGWQYRGRGMLQLTGRTQYAVAGKRLGLDLINHPDLAAEPATSLLIALDFWRQAGVNACCDRSDWTGARGLTNCGTATPKVAPIGLQDVAVRRARILGVLAG